MPAMACSRAPVRVRDSNVDDANKARSAVCWALVMEGAVKVQALALHRKSEALTPSCATVAATSDPLVPSGASVASTQADGADDDEEDEPDPPLLP